MRSFPVLRHSVHNVIHSVTVKYPTPTDWFDEHAMLLAHCMCRFKTRVKVHVKTFENKYLILLVVQSVIKKEEGKNVRIAPKLRNPA